MAVTIDVLGWIGMAFFVVGYYLVSSGRLSGRSSIYQLLNIVAAVLVGINAGYYRAYPSCAINIIWLVIGVLTVSGFIRPAGGPNCESPAKENQT